MDLEKASPTDVKATCQVFKVIWLCQCDYKTFPGSGLDEDFPVKRQPCCRGLNADVARLDICFGG